MKSQFAKNKYADSDLRIGHSLIELGDQLLVDTEDHEATILGPFGHALITLVSDNDDSETLLS